MGPFARSSLPSPMALSIAAAALVWAGGTALSTPAQDQQWNAIQQQAPAAFALMARESTAPPAELAAVQMKRLRAFQQLFFDVASFIRTNFGEDARQTPRFASALFTLALYAERSGDLWKA